MRQGNVVLFDQHNRPIRLDRAKRRVNAAGLSLFSGFKGANDENLQDWAMVPLEINQILRNDLAKLRARSRDLARNDDTARRFLNLVKQNVLGHGGIGLQAKNRLAGSKDLDTGWNAEIEREWRLFGRKRRQRGAYESPSTCGQFTLREIAWLALWSKVIDGECFIQILHGFPHNRHRFAVRFLNPDLLDSGLFRTAEEIASLPRNDGGTRNDDRTCNGGDVVAGNRIEMGIEFDEFDRAVAYHFNEQHTLGRRLVSNQARVRIPASQIIHVFRHEYVGQIRGIPDFAGIMHKAKMLNGIHEAIVVGWRVAAAKMGFLMPKTPEDEFDSGHYDGDSSEDKRDRNMVIDATPGSFEVMQDEYDLKTFDPDYPTSTYEMGNKVFMAQLSNGLNVSSPTLSNDYSSVNYSSLRQALLEDREAWRCIQAEMIDDFYEPLFEEWYDWTANITRLISVPEGQRLTAPVVEWQPRGWPWVDPLKEVQAHIAAVGANLRTRQSVIA